MTHGNSQQVYFVTGGSGYVGRNILRALISDGHRVKALARSDASASIVKDIGAEPVRGDISNKSRLLEGMKGANFLVHAAANTNHGIVTQAQLDDNKLSATNVYSAARQAGIHRALHISTEAVLLDGNPLISAEETMPYPETPAGGYSQNKADAEKIALAHNGVGMDIVVLRPRFIWGRDDTTALPQLIEAAKSGKLAWIGGGSYLTSTTHIDNVMQGIKLALGKGKAGEVYFVSDGEPVEFRDFICKLLATQNVTAPTQNVPRWVVSFLARAGDGLARLTNNKLHGPMSWQEYSTLGVEVTLNIDKARRELGYEPLISVEQGMALLAQESTG